jgi:hypothetical protein
MRRPLRVSATPPTAALIEVASCRPVYHHLATDHPVDNKHQDRTAAWFGFTSFQE